MYCYKRHFKKNHDLADIFPDSEGYPPLSGKKTAYGHISAIRRKMSLTAHHQAVNAVC